MMQHAVIVSALYVVPLMAHYSSPPDMCALSKLCNHTWVTECGVDKTNNTPRLFLDECDRYEYNCDTNKYFVAAERTACPNICTQAGHDNNFATTTPSPVTTKVLSSNKKLRRSQADLSHSLTQTSSINITTELYSPNTTNGVTVTESKQSSPTEERRDFYQVLKDRFGDRVRLMKDTTHWPRSSMFLNNGQSTIYVTGGTPSDIHVNESHTMPKNLRTLLDLYQKLYNE